MAKSKIIIFLSVIAILFAASLISCESKEIESKQALDSYSFAEPYIPEFSARGTDWSRTYRTYTERGGVYYVDDDFVEANLSHSGNIWTLMIKAKKPIININFPWQQDRRPLDDDISDDIYYYPFQLGVTRKATSINQDYHWWGLSYPGGFFSPLIVIADKDNARIVAAANWPPKKVTPYSAAERIYLRYEENISVGEAKTYKAIIEDVVATQDKEPWQVALDIYKEWLNSKMGKVEYPDWMYEGHGIISLNFQNVNNVTGYLGTGLNWSFGKKYYNWVQFWGQMEPYLGGCCICNYTMHPRYIPELTDFVKQIVSEGYHAGYYSAPNWQENLMLDSEIGEKWLLDWIKQNRDYGANAFYIDTIGNGDWGDINHVREMFYNGKIPKETFIEFGTDVYPSMYLLGASLKATTAFCGAPHKTPYNSDTSSFVRFGRYLLDDRLIIIGNIGSFFWGEKPSVGVPRWEQNESFQNSCNYTAWCEVNGPCDHWSERENFLLGARIELNAWQLSGGGNTHAPIIIEERDRVNWWERRPVYYDTVGLDLSGIPESSRIEVRRFVDKDGHDLFAVSNENLLSGYNFKFNGNVYEVPNKLYNVVEGAGHCGDGICESDETSDCHEDCKPIITTWPIWIDSVNPTNWEIDKETLLKLRDIGYTHAGVGVFYYKNIDSQLVKQRIEELRTLGFNLTVTRGGTGENYPGKEELVYGMDPENHTTNNINKKYYDTPDYVFNSCGTKWSAAVIDPSYTGILWQNTLDNVRKWVNVFSMNKNDVFNFDFELWIHPERRETGCNFQNLIKNSIRCGSNPIPNPDKERNVSYTNYMYHWGKRINDLKKEVKSNSGEGSSVLFYSEFSEYNFNINKKGYVPPKSGDYVSPNFYSLPNLTLFEKSINDGGTNWSGAIATISFCWGGDNNTYLLMEPKTVQKAGFILKKAGFIGIYEWPGFGIDNYNALKRENLSNFSYQEYVDYYISLAEAFMKGFRDGIDPDVVCGNNNTQNGITFISPTPTTSQRLSTGRFMIKAQINSPTLQSLQLLWNGKNYPILSQNAILKYNFDQNTQIGETSTTFKDLTTKANNGVGINLEGDESVQGKVNKAIQLDGVNDKIQIPHSPSHQVTSKGTWNYWVKLNSYDGCQSFISKRDTHNANAAWAMGINFGYPNVSKELTFEYNIDNKKNWAYGYDKTSIPLNQWAMLTFVYNSQDPRNVRFYVDGKEVNPILEEAQNAPLYNSNSPIYIGAVNNGSACHFNGSIDELTIIGETIIQDEIQILYESSLVKQDSSTWIFTLNKGEDSPIPQGTYTYSLTTSDPLVGSESRMLFVGAETGGQGSQEPGEGTPPGKRGEGTIYDTKKGVCSPGETNPCGSSIGECKQGTQSCVSGQWGNCVGAIGPSEEVCDGLDNNCNGQIDENCLCVEGQKKPCGSNIGICEQGVQSCVGGKWGSCVGNTPPLSEDTCFNYLDDNCNGETDEGCGEAFNTCNNGKLDEGEQGIDCGGKCPKKCPDFELISVLMVLVGLFGMIGTTVYFGYIK